MKIMQPRLRIITFHCSTRRWEREPHPLGGIKRPYSELVALFVNSARRTNPSACLELITDRDTSLCMPDFDVIHTRSIDEEALMLERLRAQRDLVRESRHGEAIAFIDTDVLVLRDIAPIFQDDFDVAVTIRDKPVFEFERRMPYNNGVVFVNVRNRDCCVQYFDTVTTLLEQRPADQWAWSGNQFVVRDLLGRRPPGATVCVNQTRVKILDCSTYNYTPASAGEEVTGKFVLHFRGEAKDLMQRYARSL